MFLIKGKKQNQQSLAVRLTFYFKFDAFRSYKDLQDDENDISSYWSAKKRYTFVTLCDFIVLKIDISL